MDAISPSFIHRRLFSPRRGEHGSDGTMGRSAGNCAIRMGSGGVLFRGHEINVYVQRSLDVINFCFVCEKSFGNLSCRKEQDILSLYVNFIVL